MACIDEHGNLTRSAEMILLAFRSPATADKAAQETGLPLFRVRAAARELAKLGFLKAGGEDYQLTARGVEKLEGN